MSIECNYCKERWYKHCHRDYPPSGLCPQCGHTEQILTDYVLNKRVEEGTLEPESHVWWMLWKHGLRGGLKSKPNIKKLECHNRNRVPCGSEPIKEKIGKHLKDDTKFRKAHTEPLKIILAAEKMVPLAARSTLVGEGGRGIIKLWGLVVLLSFPQTRITAPCLKCYQNVKYGWTMTWVFAAHTQINAECGDLEKFRTCIKIVMG